MWKESQLRYLRNLFLMFLFLMFKYFGIQFTIYVPVIAFHTIIHMIILITIIPSRGVSHVVVLWLAITN